MLVQGLRGGTVLADSGQLRQVGQAVVEDLAHALFGLCKCKVDEAFAPGEIPAVHEAKRDARHLDDAGGGGQLGIHWADRDAFHQLSGEVKSRAADAGGMLVVDMPAAAQAHRVYDDYLAELARTTPEDLATCAFSIVGRRNQVDKITRKLALLP